MQDALVCKKIVGGLEQWQNEFHLVLSQLNEKQKRLVVGLLARAAGWGGQTLLARMTGLDRKTIRHGCRDLENDLKSLRMNCLKSRMECRSEKREGAEPGRMMLECHTKVGFYLAVKPDVRTSDASRSVGRVVGRGIAQRRGAVSRGPAPGASPAVFCPAELGMPSCHACSDDRRQSHLSSACEAVR